MSLANVRAIIQDIAQFDRAERTGDSASVRFQVPSHPIVSTAGVTVNGVAQTETTDYTVDLESGVYTFTSAPAAVTVAFEYTHALLSDATIQVFLDKHENDVYAAAADALDTIATNQALILKRIKMLSLETDGPAVAKSLREHAKTFREMADADFDYAEMVVSDFNARERVWKQALRDG